MTGLRVRTLVFPTDFSDCSRHAGEQAAAIARHFGARLHVLHVDPPVTAPTPPSRVTTAAAELGAGLDVTTATTSGVPAHGICAYAQKVGADLIVMGTHGRTGVSRAVLGSVAEATVRHARCPVMTIPSPAPVTVKMEMPSSAGEVRCVVCGTSSSDLICEACRGNIRGGRALGAGRTAERPARLGSPR
jgi:nucleotide-binding universal stress UspA family protein